MNWRFWQSITQEDYIHIAISIGVILFSFILRKLFTKYIFYLLLKLSKQGKTDFFNYALKAFERPVRVLFVIIGIYVAIHYFPYISQDSQVVGHLFRVSIILIITWWLFNLSSSTSLLFMKINEKTNFKIDDILIPFLSKVVRFIIVAISFSIIAEEFGYDVSGFVAGLGLGGLAFALAAQEVIKNFFGGVVIITEKPFSIGDWVATPSVEGIVEDINFRSTIIRTFADTLVTIPNSTISNEPITNWSKMGKRRISFDLRIEYSTPRKNIEKALEDIRSYLNNSEAIHPDTIFVHLDELNESNLDIMFYFFTKTTSWGEYLKVKEKVNLKILDLLEEADVSVAFPARSIHFNNKEDKQVVQSDPTE